MCGREVKNIFHKKDDTNKKDFILLGIKTVMNFPVISKFNNIKILSNIIMFSNPKQASVRRVCFGMRWSTK
ncbi:hypothetical protein N499_0140 [Wolbachia pipientis wVitA]|nr:hypothetical protein N499_0140 [Wolbachia pipientis wVitA]